MKEVVILVAVPYDLYFATEVEIQCDNFRKFGYSSCLQVIVYEQGPNQYKEYWNKLAERYNEVKFFFYRDDSIKNLTKIYPSYARPIVLKKHWECFPELQKKVILYMDADVIFSKYLDFSPYINDDICYLSKTNYIGSNYFIEKKKDVSPLKLEQYNKRDVFEEFCNIVGIDKQLVIDNEENTGGCQYILKDINAEFWGDVAKHCIELYIHSKNTNKTFFVSESAGFQSWAIGDMCGVLWNLWKRGKQTKCPKEMTFNWATVPVEQYYDHAFFHNAGITGNKMILNTVNETVFNKADIRFRSSKMTFFDMEYQNICDKYCGIMYLKAIQGIEDPICVTNNKQLYNN